MSRVMTWIATIVLLIAAGIVSASAPAEDAEADPFFVTGKIGEPVTGRDIVATVTDARTTTLLTAADGWRSEANWLVVDLEAASVTGPLLADITGAVSLHGAVFVLDGREFRASERMDSLFGQRLNPGVPYAGALAFELSELAGTGVLQLSLTSDRRVDSVLEVPIDLDEREPADELAMPEAAWAR